MIFMSVRRVRLSRAAVSRTQCDADVVSESCVKFANIMSAVD